MRRRGGRGTVADPRPLPDRRRAGARAGGRSAARRFHRARSRRRRDRRRGNARAGGSAPGGAERAGVRGNPIGADGIGARGRRTSAGSSGAPDRGAPSPEATGPLVRAPGRFRCSGSSWARATRASGEGGVARIERGAAGRLIRRTLDRCGSSATIWVVAVNGSSCGRVGATAIGLGLAIRSAFHRQRRRCSEAIEGRKPTLPAGPGPRDVDCARRISEDSAFCMTQRGESSARAICHDSPIR